MRKAHCLVRLENKTQTVDRALCEDAGLVTPHEMEKCGRVECPQWKMSDWSLCLSSRCLSRNLAVQVRDVTCRYRNNTISNNCDSSERPIDRQECHNERCRAVWRVEKWTEVRCNQMKLKFLLSFYLRKFLN